MVMHGNSLFVAVAFAFALLLLFLAPCSAKQPLILNYTFATFFQSQANTTFQMLGPSSITTGALQITPDTYNDNYSLLNKSGRVMLPNPFKLWEVSSHSSTKNSSMESDIIASFNSTFLVNIYRPPNGSVGEGFAFVIAPDLSIPSESYGQWLGLTNATIDKNPSNQIVAIELDTVKQDFDPDDNHLGLNINSVVSNKTVSLSKFGIQISPEKAKNYTVWIQYDGRAKLMEVYMAPDEESNRPSEPFLSQKINLRDYVNQHSYMGFSASTGVTAQLNCVLMWELSVEKIPEKINLWWLKVLLGVGVPLLALMAYGVFMLVRIWKNRKVMNDPTILGALKSLPGTPREFSFKELKKATNNFDEKMKLGQGGYGVVYKGLIPQENIEIAVKKFSRDNMQGIDDFLSELSIINRLRHKHLVRLVGWCHRKSLLLLVYEYMPNGSLDNHLFGGREKALKWDQRHKIIAGVACALHYLHDEYDQRVIHRDLKASNIMLDSHFNARLGDFGLARALDNEKTSYAEIEGIPGTPGYMAPECFHTSKATTESDVYGFGAVVLEVVCGQRPWNKIAGFGSLVDWVWTLYREGRILDAVDERLMDEYDAERAQRLLLLGLACCHPMAAERPRTPQIVQIISETIPAPDVPYIKPAFVWPAMGFNIDGLTTDTQDTTPMTSSYYYGSERSDWTPRCETRENVAGFTDISLV